MVCSYLNLVQETAILVEVSEYLNLLSVHTVRICGGCFVISLDVAVFATIYISLRSSEMESEFALGDACRFACTYQPQRVSELDE